MNSICKRSVATLLSAGMILTGLTACFKTPEEKRGAEITELANKESDVKFDKIIHVNVSNVSSTKKTLYVTGYIKSDDIKEETDKFQRLKYKISNDDYNKIYEIYNKHDIYYPFDETTTELINKMMETYEPIESGPFDKTDFFYNKLNDVVEEYFK